MAMKVPEFERQVKPSELPDVRQNISVDAGNFMGATEKAFLNNATIAMDGISRAARELQLQYEQEAAQSRLTDFATQLQQHDINAQTGANEGMGWNQLQGAQALVTSNGMALEQNVIADREQFGNQLIDGLGNEHQKRLAKLHLQESGMSVYGRVANHVTQQQQKYAVGSLTGAIATSKQALATNYNDPAEFERNLTDIDAYTRQLGKITHGSEELGKTQAMGHVSDAIQGAALEALQQGDYSSAQNIAERYGRHLLPNDLANLHTKIGDNYAAGLSQSDPQSLFDMTHDEPIEKAIMQQESGGRDFNDNGEPLVSSDGKSMYAMQVTHDTARNPGFGIAPVKEQSPEEYNRVGHELIGKYRDKYHGDSAKIAAAYNAGAGSVDTAITEGGDDWQQHIPASTRDGYVPKVLGYMKTGTPLDNMTAMDRMKWNNRARSDIDRGRSVFAANLKNSITDQFAQTANTGITGAVLPEEAFHQAFGEQGPAAYADYRDRLGFNQQYFGIKDLPVDQAQAMLESAKPKEGSAEFEREQKQYDNLATAFAHASTDRNKDPMGYAMQQGYGPKPIDLSAPDTAIQEIANRPAIAQSITEKYKTPFLMLANTEAVNASAQLKAMTPDTKADTLGKLSMALPNRGAFFSLVNQIAPDSPVTKMSAGMMAFPEQVPVAQTLLKGESILNQDKTDKKQDGKPSSLPIPSDETLTEQVIKQVGSAYIGQGTTAAKRWTDMLQAVKAYYTAKAFETGKLTSDKTAIDRDLVEESITAVTGGVSSYSGSRRAFVPWGMSTDTFEKQAPAKIQKALESVGYDKTDWKNYDMAQVDNGLYQLHIKGRVVPGAIVNFNASMQVRQ